MLVFTLATNELLRLFSVGNSLCSLTMTLCSLFYGSV